MDDLNIFNCSDHKNGYYEDVLTRNFLILLKNIPQVQTVFFETIRSKMADVKIQIPSIATGLLLPTEFYTQTDSGDKIFDDLAEASVLSVLISDDEYKAKHNITNSDRHARYDGVIFCDPSWVFIIENKPYVGNVWEGQLNPNLKKYATLVEKPCCLSWRDIISLLNRLLYNKALNRIETVLTEDFLEYVDKYYDWLNPYNKFSICKDNEYLLRRRCCAIMNELGEVKYHKGWKYYIDSGKNVIKQIALDVGKAENGWKIELFLYIGNTMNSAREAYTTLNYEKLVDLLKQDYSFSIDSEFHFAKASDNIFWCEVQCSPFDYVKYWMRNSNIRQIHRGDFENYFNRLVDEKIFSEDGRGAFNEKIIGKGYQKLNVCPGFLIKYTWDSSQAIKLDDDSRFVESFKKKLKMVFGLFN